MGKVIISMPLYYFHLRSGDHRYEDIEGSDFEDNEAALSEARIAAGELSADRLRRGLPTEEALFEVQDADGSVVGTVHFPRTLV